MTAWLVEEVEQADNIVRAIEECIMPRRTTRGTGAITLSLSRARALREGINDTYRALIVRQLLNALGFDEHKPFQWRLEHKLVQALVLNHYCPAAVPVTRGLKRQILTSGPRSTRKVFEDEFPQGFYIKSALGDSSGDKGEGDKSEHVLPLIAAARVSLGGHSHLWDESWVVQERVPITIEYRVHSLEDRVIEELTLHRYGSGDIPGERDAPNAYVQSVLNRLPAAIVQGALCGWDVALTKDGRFVVIEVNFSGFHPIHRRGFQCSGYLQDKDWGAKSVARLICFIEKIYEMNIVVCADVKEESAENEFYSDVSKWRESLIEP
jgi:hypothetical protein